MKRIGHSFRYRALSERLAQLIERGVLKPGEPVPSLRQISLQEKVSVTTALQAYGLLESQGYIEAKPQSGYYVCARNRTLPPEPSVSAPRRGKTSVEVRELVHAILHRSTDQQVVPLGAAFPAPELLSCRKLDRILAAQLRRQGHRLHDYSYPPGEYDLRRQIVRRTLDWGSRLQPEEIVITCGATQALDLCMRAVTKPGDLVAVESPCYFGVLLLLEALGLSVVEVPSHPRDGISLDLLAETLRKHPVRACLVSPTFSNPLGSCMPEAAKQELVTMLSRRSIPLIEDDLFGDLCHKEPRPCPAKAFDHDGLVLLCSSFSKVLAPGYRVGWVAPGRFQKQVENLQMTTTLAVPRLLQTAIAEFLEVGAYDRQLRKMRAAFAMQSAQMIAAIGRYFPADTKVTRPSGGFLLWVELPRGADALRLSTEAFAHGIGICPGPIFSARGQYQNYIRLNCGYPLSRRMDEAVGALGRLVVSQKK